MKFTVIIDGDHEEEVVVYVRNRREIVDRLEDIVLSESEHFLGYSGAEISVLKPQDIFCFSTEGGKLFAHTDQSKLLIKERMFTVEKRLGNDFIKINQSCIINAKKIRCFDATLGGALRVTLKNGFRDCISRRQLKAVKERMGIIL